MGQNGFHTCREDFSIEVAARFARVSPIHVTWPICRVKVLPAISLQCHKCFKLSHLQRGCRKDVDWQNTYWRCSMEEHWEWKCRNAPSSALCLVEGRFALGYASSSPQCKIRSTLEPRGRRRVLNFR